MGLSHYIKICDGRSFVMHGDLVCRQSAPAAICSDKSWWWTIPLFMGRGALLYFNLLMWLITCRFLWRGPLSAALLLEHHAGALVALLRAARHQIKCCVKRLLNFKIWSRDHSLDPGGPLTSIFQPWKKNADYSWRLSPAPDSRVTCAQSWDSYCPHPHPPYYAVLLTQHGSPAATWQSAWREREILKQVLKRKDWQSREESYVKVWDPLFNQIRAARC